MTDPVASPAPLLTHLVELKRRLLIASTAWLAATILCYTYASSIYALLVRPLALATEGASRRMIYTGLTEAFFTYLKLAMFGGIVLAFPVIAWQAYAFLAPGLYKQERRAVLPYLFAGPLLFLMGAGLCYGFVFPAAWHFFLGFESPGGANTLPIQLEAKVSEYLSLSMHLILAFGFAFQLPVILSLLAQTGLVSHAFLARYRRHAIVAMFAVAAVITPPDVISQLMLAIPLAALYELSLISVKLITRRKPVESTAD